MRLRLAFLLLLACKSRAEFPAPLPVPASKTLSEQERKVIEEVYSGELKNGWMDYGWSDRQLNAGPATVDLSDYGGWIIAKFGTQPTFGGLKFKYRALSGEMPPFDVRLEKDGGAKFPKVVLGPSHTLAKSGEWTQALVTLAELNPEERPFDRIVFQGKSGKKVPPLQFDEIGWSWVDPARAAGAKVATGPAADSPWTVSCQAKGSVIHPGIYGIALDPMKHQDPGVWEIGATSRRWGGNPASRYNWKLGNAWNTAADWFFENVNYTDNPNYSYRLFLEENRAKQVTTALTLPTLGWVAKDITSYAFPVSRFGQQQQTDSYRPEAGNGKSPDGKPIKPGPPSLTSVEASPAFIADWVKAIRAQDKDRGGRSVFLYILDNEPMLWHETHRDVHPERATYDELWNMTVKYGTAVRQAAPEALIAGPAEWGWSSYFYSAADLGSGVLLRPDRRKHGDVPLLVWYLRKLHEHQQKTGVKLVDVLDVHYYPQGKGMGLGDSAQTDPASAALRLRSTRSLWDPLYKDESWIDDNVQLLPRLKQWIAENNPGMGISIGEYNFGAEKHMSGGLAQAEALGRFGQQGILAAYFWMYPPKDSPAFWAFRAFRNYDGQGGRFQDVSVPVQGADGQVSLFASRDESGSKYILVALNRDPSKAANAAITLEGCGEMTGARAYQYAGDPKGFQPATVTANKTLKATLPPYSITVLELHASTGQRITQ